MIVSLKGFMPVFLAVLLLCGSVIATAKVKTEDYKNKSITTSKTTSQESTTTASQIVNTTSTIANNVKFIDDFEEIRGIWIPFMSLDMKGTDFSEAAFRAKFDNMVSKSKSYGLNTLIVHVRPYGDSMYPSEIFPWSHLLTGTQGNDPGFDPLAYMVQKTHSEGMQFHAWINPLRIQSKGNPSTLAANNPYNQWRNDSDTSNDDYVVDFDGGKYYNPAYPQVQAKIISGIREIVKNYPVDAIHFDDYFYPTQDESFDKNAYTKYCSKISDGAVALSLQEWRTNNINTLISGVYSAIKSENSNVKFGISPQCNIQNDINMGADVYTWGSASGYVDYLCPQVYVSFNHPTLTFDKSANDWKNLVTNPEVKLYYGLAVYKSGSDMDSGTWQGSNEILKQQIEYGRNLDADGFMLYSWDYMDTDQTKEEVANVVKMLTQ